MTIVLGGNGADLIAGTASSDILFGGSGADSLNGGAGDDLLFGGNGNDVASGGAGDDILFGGNGDDLLLGDDATAAASNGTEHTLFTSTVAANGEPFFEVIGNSSATLPSAGIVQVWHSRATAEISLEYCDAHGVPISGRPVLHLGAGYEPAVAAQSNGSVVVVWQSNGSTYGSLVSPAGVPSATPFTVSDSGQSNTTWQGVMALKGGGFIVSFGGVSNGQGYDAFLKFYDAAGNAVGSTVVANSLTAGDQKYASLAQAGNGDVVAVWSSDGQDGSGYGIYARHFSSTGAALSGDVKVNSATALDQNYPSVVTLEDGSYVVVWSTPATSGTGFNIAAQHYAANGSALGGELALVADGSLNGTSPATIAALRDGGFALAWEATAGATNSSEIFARSFDSAFHATSDVAQVNQTTDGDQIKPSVTATADGGYVISWSTTRGGVGLDGVYDRYFAAPATPGGDDIISGGNGNDTINGNGGDDLLFGGNGADRFIFQGSFGTDVVGDFTHGSDILVLTGQGLSSFTDIASRASQVGNDLHIHLAGGEIVLSGHHIADLSLADFVLG